MPEPSVFLFRPINDNYELYLCEYTTAQGLLLFEDDQKVVVRSANGNYFTNNDWVTEKSFETIHTAQSLVRFLDDDSGIDLIDIEIEIEGFGNLRTHDDGECHFRSANKDGLISLLKKIITEREFLPLQISLLEHPNKYVTYPPTGNIVVYSTFDEYLSSTE